MDTIGRCSITIEGFEMTSENLLDQYENKLVLVSTRLKPLFNFPVTDKESSPVIKELQRTIND